MTLDHAVITITRIPHLSPSYPGLLCARFARPGIPFPLLKSKRRVYLRATQYDP